MDRLFKKSRISWYKQEQLIEHFVAGTTARCANELIGVNHKTSAYYFHRLREIIFYEMEQQGSNYFGGKIEVDESYFGGSRKGKRGRGAKAKTPVFGLLKRGEKVYTQMIPDASGDTLIPIIESKVVPDSIVYSDGWKGYNALDVTDFHHMRINHSTEFADGDNHINGIENFWNQAKRHMRTYNSISKQNFVLYLKECEWRFNHSGFKSQKKQWTKKYLG